ncbi:glycosyltransferase [Planctomycetota bacterium]
MSKTRDGDHPVTQDGQFSQRGKFLFLGENKFYVRGVTYGTFCPDANGDQFGTPAQVESDFEMMARFGINTVRIYTAPPRWLLDIAHDQGLFVMVGLPWEQHITFLDERSRRRSIIERVRQGVQACAGHPAVLCYAVGNEIPASIVRWHGAKRVEYFIKELYQVAKTVDPDSLVTYVNFPTTEYLQLPFLDFYCFNVYLETQSSLEAYLARLQNLAGNKPLLMAEVGLDSRRNGMEFQAEVLDWQIRSTFASGCAGIFMFSWTDEWYRGGCDIEDWDFGLTTRDRTAKPSLAAVQTAFAEIPFSHNNDWPRISVVLCSYNGSALIEETIIHLLKLNYPDYEIIVVNDGSTDATPEIAGKYDVQLISVENGGLSRARNLGMEAATGEIVAYIDDDAYPDPHWLWYLAHTFKTTDHAGVGGPNIQPTGDGPIAECVTNAPGGPIHVLVSDREAEHIPGCNMAFRKTQLQAIGGFDPQFWVAGDDVDVCWRLLEKGWTIGFHAAALVWHHRRNSIRTFWRQQAGYGKAESLLEKKWPEKYNSLGHATWSGRIYDGPSNKILRLRRSRIYHGIWGTAPFQKLYQPQHSVFSGLHTLPEWYLVILMFSVLSALGLAWTPLLIAFPLLLLMVSIPLVQAITCSRHANYPSKPQSRFLRLKLQAITVLLHLMQPLARLWGRFKHGLTPWRIFRRRGSGLPGRCRAELWSETWQSTDQWLESLESAIKGQGIVVQRGDNFAPWDLSVRGGLFSSLHICMAIEEHGEGKQLARFRGSPRFSLLGIVSVLLYAGLFAWASMENQWLVSGILGASVAVLVSWMICEWAYAGKVFQTAVKDLGAIQDQPD